VPDDLEPEPLETKLERFYDSRWCLAFIIATYTFGLVAGWHATH